MTENKIERIAKATAKNYALEFQFHKGTIRTAGT